MTAAQRAFHLSNMRNLILIMEKYLVRCEDCDNLLALPNFIRTASEAITIAIDALDKEKA